MPTAASAKITGGRLEIVDVLRGLAALAVTWFHVTNQHTSGAQFTGSLGWLGVDSFFVLSGFVIPLSLHGKGYTITSFWRFLARRLARLEPPYLVSIGLVIALVFVSQLIPGYAGQPVHYTVGAVASHLLYLAPLTGHEWINPVYWTLAYEFVFYIVVGLTFSHLAVRHIGFPIALAAAILCARYALTQEFDPRILQFLLGISAMRYFVGRDRIEVFLATLAVSCVAMAVGGFAMNAVVGGLTALCLVFVKAPRIPGLAGLGLISYSLYLVHVPIGGRVVNLGKPFGEGLAFDIALSLVAVVACLVTAYLFYRCVEVLATRWSKTIALAPPIPSDAAPVTAKTEAPAER